MIVKVTEKKKKKILEFCEKVFSMNSIVIREFASLIGKLQAACKGVDFGPLFCKYLEIDKNEALKKQAGNFDAKMLISEKTKMCLRWWIDNLDSQVRVIDHGDPDCLLHTDASLIGWGVQLEGVGESNGFWSLEELDLHINALELLAVFYALKCFCSEHRDCHIRVEVDNTTAVHYIENMGGVKSEKCNDISFQIWSFCLERNIWLSAVYINPLSAMGYYSHPNPIEVQNAWH